MHLSGGVEYCVGVGSLLSCASQGWKSGQYILSACCVYFPFISHVLSIRHYRQSGFTKHRHATVLCTRLVLQQATKRERKRACLMGTEALF